MKSKNIKIIIILFIIFCFLVLLKGLKNENTYIPENISQNVIKDFVSKELYSQNSISSHEIFKDNKFYILNIWASWCLPCREEHPKLMELSRNSSVKLIGLNYKDSKKKAKKFISEYGNPFSLIITDDTGIISIELGAYGVPETFVINNNKKIIKKFIGPLNQKHINEINSVLK